MATIECNPLLRSRVNPTESRCSLWYTPGTGFSRCRRLSRFLLRLHRSRTDCTSRRGLHSARATSADWESGLDVITQPRFRLGVTLQPWGTPGVNSTLIGEGVWSSELLW